MTDLIFSLSQELSANCPREIRSSAGLQKNRNLHFNFLVVLSYNLTITRLEILPKPSSCPKREIVLAFANQRCRHQSTSTIRFSPQHLHCSQPHHVLPPQNAPPQKHRIHSPRPSRLRTDFPRMAPHRSRFRRTRYRSRALQSTRYQSTPPSLPIIRHNNNLKSNSTC